MSIIAKRRETNFDNEFGGNSSKKNNNNKFDDEDESEYRKPKISKEEINKKKKFVEAVDFTVCLFLERNYVQDLKQKNKNQSLGNFLQTYFE